MIFRILILVCIVFSSCKRDKFYDISITGVVTDQVTGQPVSDANILIGTQRAGMSGNTIVSPKIATTSSSDGTYKCTTSAESGDNMPNVPIGLRGLCIAISASKSGYAGGNRTEIPYYDGKDMVVNIQLYH